MSNYRFFAAAILAFGCSTNQCRADHTQFDDMTQLLAANQTVESVSNVSTPMFGEPEGTDAPKCMPPNLPPAEVVDLSDAAPIEASTAAVPMATGTPADAVLQSGATMTSHWIVLENKTALPLKVEISVINPGAVAAKGTRTLPPNLAPRFYEIRFSKALQYTQIKVKLIGGNEGYGPLGLSTGTYTDSVLIQARYGYEHWVDTYYDRFTFDYWAPHNLI